MKSTILSIVTAFALVTGSAHAATFEFLTHPAFVGFWPGLNQTIDCPAPCGDDILFSPALANDPTNVQPGQPLNQLGSSGSYHANDPTTAGLPPGGLFMGFFTGGWSTSSVLGDQAVIGTNTISTLSVAFEENSFSSFTDGFTNTPSTINDPAGVMELAAGFAHTMTFGPGNTYISEYFFRDPLLPINTWHTTTAGTGKYLTAGQDPGVVFAGDAALIAYFSAIIPLADVSNPGWTFLGTEIADYELVGVPGLEGSFSAIVVSSSPFAVPTAIPLPPALLMLVSSILTLAGVNARKRSA